MPRRIGGKATGPLLCGLEQAKESGEGREEAGSAKVRDEGGEGRREEGGG